MHRISFTVGSSKLASQNSAGGEMLLSLLPTTTKFSKHLEGQGTLQWQRLTCLLESSTPEYRTHFMHLTLHICSNALAGCSWECPCRHPVPHLQRSCCLGPPRCQPADRNLLPWPQASAAAHAPGPRWLQVVPSCPDSETVLSPGIWARACPAPNNTAQEVWAFNAPWRNSD